MFMVYRYIPFSKIEIYMKSIVYTYIVYTSTVSYDTSWIVNFLSTFILYCFIPLSLPCCHGNLAVELLASLIQADL